MGPPARGEPVMDHEFGARGAWSVHRSGGGGELARPERPVSTGRVLVTGASRGIGRAVVAALAARGARVAAVARDHKALESVAAADPSRIVPLPADLDLASERDAVVQRAIERLGGVDALVCAAGVVRYARVGALDEEHLRLQWRINLVAPLLMAQEAALWMKEHGGGAILFVGSTLASRPAPSTAGYAATKAALVAAAQTLALELAPQGVRVNVVSPGVVDTDMVRQVRLEPGEPEPVGPARQARVDRQLAELRRLHPLGRLGRPEDVVQAILYLLDATWVTGSVLTVDGGLLVG